MDPDYTATVGLDRDQTRSVVAATDADTGAQPLRTAAMVRLCCTMPAAIGPLEATPRALRDPDISVNVNYSGDYSSALHLLVVRAGGRGDVNAKWGENPHVTSKDDS